MAEPADVIAPMLRGLRRENVALHQQTRELIAELGRRIALLERQMRDVESHF